MISSFLWFCWGWSSAQDLSESAEITFSHVWDYPGLPYFGAGWGWGQVSPFTFWWNNGNPDRLCCVANWEHSHLNACSSIEKFVPPCRGSMETRRRLFASLESKQEKLWEEIWECRFLAGAHTQAATWCLCQVWSWSWTGGKNIAMSNAIGVEWHNVGGVPIEKCQITGVQKHHNL